MTELTNEMLYEELLKLDLRLAENEAAFDELIVLMKDMNREFAEERAKTEALKRRLFKDRFDAQGALIG
jgi:hypothetical protein